MGVGAIDVVVLTAAAVVGNVGVAVTGFGMAIVFIFVWQIAVLSGYDSDFKRAVFVQSLALFAAQPLLLYNAGLRRHATYRLLRLMLPVTVVATPLGQLVGRVAPVEHIQAVSGCLVTGVAIFELYRNRALIMAACGGEARATPGGRAEARLPSGALPAGSDFDRSAPVFFMVGSQRSGSNWLQTMINEREELAAPHPPHVLQEFMPILPKFGDLRDPAQLEILVHHVCAFVERNQVVWTDRHDVPIRFDRARVLEQVVEWVADADPDGEAGPGMRLVAVFDELMNTYAIANNKRTWMCKSMGVSEYHDLLLRFYGSERLRYVYLVRDVRDVAMSFMNTPVGDCHYHAIVTKWCQLQDFALKIMDEKPELTHTVRYEDLLRDTETVLEDLNDFIGERKFARSDSHASVLAMHEVAHQVDAAKSGREAKKRAELSDQFKNLVRGKSFAQVQDQKWLKGECPLSRSDLILIESVAHATMRRLGYAPHLVTVSVEPTIFSSDDLATFARLNAEGIKQMQSDLLEDNPEDAHRRSRQKAVLSYPPTLLPVDDLSPTADRGADEVGHGHDEYLRSWPVGAERHGYLTQAQVQSRLQTRQEHVVDLPDGYRFRCAVASQGGYYPTDVEKENQDAFRFHPDLCGPGKHYFAVYDGHGPAGEKCARFAAEHVPGEFRAALQGLPAAAPPDAAASALAGAHVRANRMLAEHPEIDDTASGTTAVTLYMDGRECYVANVGDSSCMVGSLGPGGKVVVEALSRDQTPHREDERERVKGSGARVMTAGQLEGSEPMHEEWGRGEVPRVWAQDRMSPGTAFTRSIGDSDAEGLGIVAEPELARHTVGESDRIIVVASDGITEFISKERCIEIALSFSDPLEACLALVGESYKLWMKARERTDDITVMVGFIEPPGCVDGGTGMQAVVLTVDEPKAAPAEEFRLTGIGGQAWAFSMAFASGFFGGLCGIRGPPIIVFFLHVRCSKAVQRANGAMITFVNVSMRIVYYVFEGLGGRQLFVEDDLPLYAAILVFSPLAACAGARMFNRLSDSQATIKTILAFLLVMSGVSLLITIWV